MKKGNFHVKLGCKIHDGTNHGQQMHNHVHLISLYKLKYFNNAADPEPIPILSTRTLIEREEGEGAAEREGTHTYKGDKMYMMPY